MDLDAVKKAKSRIKDLVRETPLEFNARLSNEFDAEIWLKREDLQTVRSYKIRGAYNKVSKLTVPQRFYGVVCASAGNHAQGVALACSKLEIKSVIFMPLGTPAQKVTQVRLFGGENCDIRLVGDTFDDAQHAAIKFCKENNATFVHPFDDCDVIAGQGTVGLEIITSSIKPIDFLFLPIGGGGLAAGVSTVFKILSPKTKIIGIEPKGAPSMSEALKLGRPTKLKSIDKFIDGAAVKKVGELNFEICKTSLDDVITVPEGKVCSEILKLYNKDAIVVEPAGALTIAALEQYKNHIKDKSVVCVVSGGNNDIDRTEEIRERALLYEGKKHYFLIEFPQRPGALKEFIQSVLKEGDDITYFQFSKKNNRESGPAVVGLELAHTSKFQDLEGNLNTRGYRYTYLNDNSLLFSQLI